MVVGGQFDVSQPFRGAASGGGGRVRGRERKGERGREREMLEEKMG